MATNDVSVRAEALLRRAGDARARGRPAEALALLRQVLALRPDHPLAHNALGTAALAGGDPALARTHFRQACAADGGATPLWLNLAVAERRLGDDAGERTALEGALAVDQRDLMALVRLAELHERRGETTQAAQRWSAVLAAAPPPPERGQGLDPILAHATAFVAGHGAAFGAAIEQAFEANNDTIDAAGRRRIDAAVGAMLGRRRIYTNQCSGLHIPFLPADEYFDEALFPWLPRLEAATDAIRGIPGAVARGRRFRALCAARSRHARQSVDAA